MPRGRGQDLAAAERRGRQRGWRDARWCGDAVEYGLDSRGARPVAGERGEHDVIWVTGEKRIVYRSERPSYPVSQVAGGRGLGRS